MANISYTIFANMCMTQNSIKYEYRCLTIGEIFNTGSLGTLHDLGAIHDTCIYDVCTHDTFIHGACIHDACIYDAYIHNVMRV